MFKYILAKWVKELLKEEDNIPKFTVTCICNTLVEVEENSVGECPNCHRGIDDRGVIY